jgi:hypothetical protein
MTTDTAPRFTQQDMLAWANNSKLTPTIDGMLRQAAADLANAPTRDELATMLWQLHLPVRFRDKTKTIANINEVNRAQWYEDAGYLIAAGVKVRA